MAKLFLNPNFCLEGLRQAPKINQPFVPDTAPVRQTRSVTQPATSNQENPMSYTPSFHATGAEGSNTVESGEASRLTRIDSPFGEETMLVSIRDVSTPGNRPEQFRRQGKEAKQFDYHDPYYPLQFLEIDRSEYNNISCCIHACSQYFFRSRYLSPRPNGRNVS